MSPTCSCAGLMQVYIWVNVTTDLCIQAASLPYLTFRYLALFAWSQTCVRAPARVKLVNMTFNLCLNWALLLIFNDQTLAIIHNWCENRIDCIDRPLNGAAANTRSRSRAKLIFPCPVSHDCAFLFRSVAHLCLGSFVSFLCQSLYCLSLLFTTCSFAPNVSVAHKI